MKELDEYQDFVNEVSTGHHYRYLQSQVANGQELPERLSFELIYNVLGLAGEAGEVANDLKKAIRNTGMKGCFPLENGSNGISDDARLKLVEELGDTLYYVARSADMLGVRLSDVAKNNEQKLKHILAAKRSKRSKKKKATKKKAGRGAR